jgi:hypothetical protein
MNPAGRVFRRKCFVTLRACGPPGDVICAKCGCTARREYGFMLPSEWLQFEAKNGEWRTYCGRCAQLGFKRIGTVH